LADLDRAFRQYYEQGYNSAPLELMAQLLERIVQGKAVSPRASKAMLEIMQGTQTGARRVKAGLGADVTLATRPAPSTSAPATSGCSTWRPTARWCSPSR